MKYEYVRLGTMRSRFPGGGGGWCCVYCNRTVNPAHESRHLVVYHHAKPVQYGKRTTKYYRCMCGLQLPARDLVHCDTCPDIEYYKQNLELVRVLSQL